MAALLTPKMLWDHSDRKAAAISWCEDHGFPGDRVASCEALPDGKVRVVELLVNDEGHKYYDPATDDVAKRVVDITPKTPPPWLDWTP